VLLSVPVRVRADFERVYPAASRHATECAMNLVKTGDMVVSRVASLLSQFDITPAGGLVLSMLVEAAEPLPQSSIRERLLVSGPTVTGVLDSLERRRLVRRLLQPGDRRRRRVEITSEGGAVAAAFLPLIHAAERPWMACLSDAEQQLLIELLGRIQQQLATTGEANLAPPESVGDASR
jgi:DNA-binding MarR family transcriptional regulator